MDRYKTALALSGGGGIGSYHIGVIEALIAFGIIIDDVYGGSIGGVVGGASTYNYKNPQILYEQWMRLTPENVLGLDSSKYINMQGKALTAKLYFDTFRAWNKDKGIGIDKIRTILNDTLDPKKIIESDMGFAVVLAKRIGKHPFKQEYKNVLLDWFLCHENLQFQGVYKENMTIDNVLLHILATCNLPIFRQEPILDGNYYVDCTDMKFGRHPVSLVKNVNSVVFISHLSHKLKKWEKTRLLGTNNTGNTILITPSILTTPMLDFSPEAARKNRELGYEDGCRIIEATRHIWDSSYADTCRTSDRASQKKLIR